jgi:potassium large conductance calcium-activated channel subfamily M alpha protein 1
MSTLVANLFYTINVEKFVLTESEHEAWKKDYVHGMSTELYAGAFSEAFEGMTFHEAARICYKKLNIVLIAVDNIERGMCSSYINPSPKSHPHLHITSKTMLGYFIAEDQKQVLNVSIYCECCDGNKHTDSMKTVRRLKRQLVMTRWRTSTNFFDQENGLSLTNMKTSAAGPVFRNGTAKVKKKPMPPHSEVQEEDDLSEIVVENQGANSSITLADQKAVTAHRHSVRPTSISSDDDYESYDDDEEEEEDEEDELVSMGKSCMHICDPVRMNDAILNPLIFEESRPLPSHLKKHIILCLFAKPNSPILGLYNFLKPLRSKHLPLQSIKPVVIICNKDLVEKEWPIICRFPKVYLVLGSPLLWKNLRAANVKNCSVCIVLTVHRDASGHEQAIDDKEAILCTLSIKNHLKKIRKKVTVITDLRQESNVQFLDFGDDDQPDERIFKSQPYACGEAFSVSMFDSVTSSAFHNPGAVSIIEDLIFSENEGEFSHVIPMSIKGTEYIGKCYKDFYNDQLTKFNICLGISSELPGSNGHSHFVASCPVKNLILQETDTAFVLTSDLSTC